ncbi:MAG: hypothetical protein ED557_05555 [Balneola sp.]|nr:MAG: hypothetical protein ED557_05555 [Balneola sp.]
MKFLGLGLLWIGLAIPLFGQSISYSANEKPLPEILEDISDNYAVFFSYSVTEIPAEPISIEVDNTSLSVFLVKILSPYGLSFEVVEGNFIAIKPAEEIGALLSFHVIDSETGDPIELVLARQLNSYKGTYSDLDGYIELYVNKPSQYEVELTHLGYESQTFQALELYTSANTTIALTPKSSELGSITVTEYLNTGIIVKEDASTVTIRPQNMNVLPGLSEPDALYSLHALPGINAQDESASGLNIRGGSNDQVSMYWDDIPLYHTGHYFGLVSAVIPSSINSVNVYRSAIPTQFGGATSGLLEMKGPTFLPRKTSGDVNSNLTHASGSIAVPFKKHGFLFSGRRSYTDIYQSATFDAFQDKLFNASEFSRDGQPIEIEDGEGDEVEKQELVFWDFNGKWIWQPDYRNQLSISVFTNGNKLDYRTTNEGEQNAQFQFHEVNTAGINLAWDRFWSDRFESRISASVSSYDLEYDFLLQREVDPAEFEASEQLSKLDDHDEEDDEEEDEEEDPFDGGFASGVDSLSDRALRTNNILNTEIRAINTLSLGNNQLKFGGQLNILDVDFTLSQVSTYEDDFFDRTKNSGIGYSLFGNYIFGVGQPFRIDAGVRASRFGFVDIYTIDPQLNISYSPTNWLQLKASTGRYHQYIRTLKNFDNSISSRTEEIWYMSDKEDFPVLRSEQISGGFVVQHSGWLLDAEAYSRRINGLISLNYNFGGLELDDEESSGEDIIHGLDVLLRKRINNYRAWISYSLVDAESFFPDFEDERFPSFLDQKHQLQIVQSLEIGNFEFSTGWTFKTGAPYTEPQNEEVIEVVEVDEGETETETFFVIEWGETNSKRLPNYHRLDFSIWYKVPRTLSRSFNAEVGLSFLNLYDRTNILNRFYYPDEIDSDEEIEIVEEERYLLGFTPNLNIKISF